MEAQGGASALMVTTGAARNHGRGQTPPALPAPLVILTLCSKPRAKRAYFFLSVNFKEIKIAIGVTSSSCGNLLG